MFRSPCGAVALIVCALSSVPLAAQSFTQGTLVNAFAVTSSEINGVDMLGMELTLSIAGGGTLSTVWAELGNGICGGSFSNGFRVSLGCTTNTYAADGSSIWSIVNSSQDGILALRMNGAPGKTVFDCGFSSLFGCSGVGGPDEGTPGSGLGFSLANRAGGSYGFNPSSFYTNLVGVAGNPAIGDLFEQLTLTFDNVLPANGTYLFGLDTDNATFRAVPPVSPVPEPSTYALMFTGLTGIFLSARRRRIRSF